MTNLPRRAHKSDAIPSTAETIREHVEARRRFLRDLTGERFGIDEQRPMETER